LINTSSNKIYSEIKITLVFENNHIAETINNSTSPENQETPEGIFSSSKINENKIILTIKSEKSLLDLLGTLEDYFEKIDLSYKTIKLNP